MLRAMAFIDYENFDIALKNYYKGMKKPFPRLDYQKLALNICKEIGLGDAKLLKTMLFAPKPDKFLLNDPFWQNYERSISGLQAKPFFDVIEGRFVTYPVDDSIPKNINNKLTYYKVEKGTDINIASNMLTMAFNNSYDIAILVSCDSDYVTVLSTLRTIGKLSFVAMVERQNSHLVNIADSYFVMQEPFFNTSLR